jgi:hypothetical protein
MFFVPHIPKIAGAIAVSFSAICPTASGESLVEGPTRYGPIQSIRYDFGSKSMSGHFLQRESTCLVTLMVIEKSDPEKVQPVTAARVRLMLSPGQIAGLDSEEGRSLNFTCGEGGATLVVDSGERAKLVAAQQSAVPKSVAEEP